MACSFLWGSWTMPRLLLGQHIHIYCAKPMIFNAFWRTKSKWEAGWNNAEMIGDHSASKALCDSGSCRCGADSTQRLRYCFCEAFPTLPKSRGLHERLFPWIGSSYVSYRKDGLNFHDLLKKKSLYRWDISAPTKTWSLNCLSRRYVWSTPCKHFTGRFRQS
jgi:hypothetical protein